MGTLRRKFFNRPGTMYQTPEALIVNLDPFAGQEALIPVIDEFNAAGPSLALVGEPPRRPLPDSPGSGWTVAPHCLPLRPEKPFGGCDQAMLVRKEGIMR